MTSLSVPPRPGESERRWSVEALVVVVAGLLAYAGSFPGILVFDDFSSIVENASIRSLWPPAAVLWPPAEAGVGGRPVANLSYALNYAAGGNAAWSYHATNLALHLASALLLFGLARRTLRFPAALPLAGAIATLWAVHPLTTAVVNYASQRTEALAACAALLTLYAFVRGWSAVAVAACALGMASKEVMVATPLIVLLYDRAFLADSFRTAWRARGRLHLALMATWLLLAGLMLASRLGDRGVGFGQGVTWVDYAFTQARAVPHYLLLALSPTPLVFDYGWDFVTDARTAAPYLAACVALVAVALVTWWRRPALGFCAVAALLWLAPTSTVVPIVQQPMAESRMYLPLAGLVALVVVGGYHAVNRRAALAVAGCLALAVALGFVTHRRHAAYRSEIALWEDTLVKRPTSARAYGNLSAALFRADRTAEAIVAAQAAVALRRDYSEAHYNLGHALARAGRGAEAVPHFEFLLRGRPGDAHVHNNLAVVLLPLGRIEDAIAHSRAALATEPGFAEAHYNLGTALFAASRVDEAATAFRAALQHDPKFARAENNLGVLHLRAGRVAEAVAHFEAALRLDPNYAEPKRNLERVRRSR